MKCFCAAITAATEKLLDLTIKNITIPNCRSVQKQRAGAACLCRCKKRSCRDQKYISGGSRRGHCIREAEHGQKYRGDHTVCKPAGTDRAGDQRKPPRKFSLWNGACFSGRRKGCGAFSTALSDRTNAGTYQWLKNNKELINVATSRAKDKLVLLADSKELERLHAGQADDDLYELAQYIKTNGKSEITENISVPVHLASSRFLPLPKMYFSKT